MFTLEKIKDEQTKLQRQSSERLQKQREKLALVEEVLRSKLRIAAMEQELNQFSDLEYT